MLNNPFQERPWLIYPKVISYFSFHKKAMGNVSVLVLSNGGTTRSLLSGTATEYLEVCPSPQAANGGGKPFAANPLSGAEVLQPPW